MKIKELLPEGRFSVSASAGVFTPTSPLERDRNHKPMLTRKKFNRIKKKRIKKSTKK